MASGDTTQQGGSSQVPRGAPQGISLEFLLSLQTPVQPSMSSIEEHSSAEAKAEGLTHLNDWDAETQIKSSLIDPESHITKEQVKDLRNESGKIVERMVSLQKQFQTTNDDKWLPRIELQKSLTKASVLLTSSLEQGPTTLYPVPRTHYEYDPVVRWFKNLSSAATIEERRELVRSWFRSKTNVEGEEEDVILLGAGRVNVNVILESDELLNVFVDDLEKVYESVVNDEIGDNVREVLKKIVEESRD